MNSLLQMMDAPIRTVCWFSAPTFNESLDSGFLRRSGLTLHMPEPTDAQRATMRTDYHSQTVPELASDPEFSGCLVS